MLFGRYVVWAYIEKEYGYKVCGTRIKIFNCFGYSKILNATIERSAIKFAETKPYDLYKFDPVDKDRVVFDVEYEEYNDETKEWEIEGDLLTNVSDHYKKVDAKVKAGLLDPCVDNTEP